MKKRRNLIKKTKEKIQGITLVALVVTIIVLLILAGVAISLTIGSNGIFTRAKKTAEMYEIASKEEQNELNSVANFIDGYINGNKQDNEDNENGDDNVEEEEGAMEISQNIWDLSTLTDEEKNIDGYYLIKNDCTIIESKGEGVIVTTTANKVLKIANNATCTIENTIVGGFAGNIEIESNATLDIQSGQYLEKVIANENSKLNILGGTYSKDIVANQGANVEILGGTFLGNFQVNGNASLQIKGGMFANDPSEYVAPGCKLENTGDGMYFVTFQE